MGNTTLVEMIYRFLKILVGIGIRLYYRQIRVNNREYLDEKGPKILIANHPNTLMDAWMVGHMCKERVYYMAKGTFFSSPFKRWLLNGLGMIPVNRMVDQKIKGVSNEDSFEACYRLLEEGKTLLIFPEGNSFQERLLRKLKSGAARIALQTELRNEGKLGLKVIPIGLIYTQPERFRSSVLANIGKPIDPQPHLELFKTDSLKAARKLTEEFTTSMSRLLVNSEIKQEEGLVEDIVEILSSSYVKSDKRGVEKQVDLMKRTFEQINALRVAQPWKIEEVKLMVTEIKWQVQQLKIKSDFLDRRYRGRMFTRQLITSIVSLVLGLPLFLYGIIHNFLIYKLVDKLVTKLINDVEYIAPISVLFSMVVYPGAYLGFMALANHFLELEPWMKWTYFASMPITGLFSFYYYQYYRHVALKRRYMILMKREKGTVESLREDREALRSVLFD